MSSVDSSSDLHIYFAPLVNPYKLTILLEELEFVS